MIADAVILEADDVSSLVGELLWNLGPLKPAPLLAWGRLRELGY